MSKKLKGNVIKKIANVASGGSVKKKPTTGSGSANNWLHSTKDLQDSYVTYHAKYLGSVEVMKAKGVDVVKDAIKKLKISYQLKKSEAGHKGSKLQKVEIHVSIDFVRIVETRTKAMICSRPLHRVSYCADDHADKRLFAFIAKEQETKKHQCYVLICEREASQLTITLGQAFQMAYRRYVDKEKDEIKKTKDEINICKRLENELLSPKLKANVESMKNEKDKNTFDFNGSLASKDNTTSVNVDTKKGSNTTFNQGVGMFYQIDPPPKTNTVENGQKPTDYSNKPNKIDRNSTTSKTLVSLNDSFNERFSNHSWVSEQEEEFNFKSDVSIQRLDFKRVLSDDDFFGAFDSTEIVNTDVDLTNNGEENKLDITANGFEENDLFSSQDQSVNFDGFTDFSSSPTMDDFNPKYDPFADVPDWNSVASEEVSNPSKPGSICLDPSDIQTSVHSLKDDILEVNNKNTNIKSENFPDMSHLSFDSNDEINRENPFDNYLSNIVANRTDNDRLKNSNPFAVDIVLDEANSNNSFSSIKNEVKTTGPSNSNFQLDFLMEQNNNDSFSAQKNQLDLSFFDNNQYANNTTFPSGNINGFDESFSNNSESVLAVSKEEVKMQQNITTTPLQTSRPRPSSLLVQPQILPAPPTKESIKKANSPISGPPTQPSPPKRAEGLSVKEKPKPKSGLSVEMKPRSASHILPNVSKVNEADLGLSKRSRVSGSFSVRPIKDSILMASKSLEDLDDIGSK